MPSRTATGLREGSAFEFDALHKGFHTAMVAACGSPRMLAAHSDLYDQAYRYRRIMMRAFEDKPDDFVDRTIAELADLVHRAARQRRRRPSSPPI